MSANDRMVGGTHYTKLTVTPWTAMEAWMDPQEFAGFLLGNVIKYTARAGKKGSALEDLQKAQHYLEKLIEHVQKVGEKPNND